MSSPVLWLGVGLLGQAMFFSRFLLQWLASERARRSTFPMAFWYFSLAGGVLLLVYAIWRHDPVFILGQTTGAFIYLRNISLRKRENRSSAGASSTTASPER